MDRKNIQKLQNYGRLLSGPRALSLADHSGIGIKIGSDESECVDRTTLSHSTNGGNIEVSGRLWSGAVLCE